MMGQGAPGAGSSGGGLEQPPQGTFYLCLFGWNFDRLLKLGINL